MTDKQASYIEFLGRKLGARDFRAAVVIALGKCPVGALTKARASEVIDILLRKTR